MGGEVGGRVILNGMLPWVQGYSRHKCRSSQVPEDAALRVGHACGCWVSLPPTARQKCYALAGGREVKPDISSSHGWQSQPTVVVWPPKQDCNPKAGFDKCLSRVWVRGLFSLISTQCNMALVAWSIDTCQLWRRTAVTWAGSGAGDGEAGGQKSVQGNQRHSGRWDHRGPRLWVIGTYSTVLSEFNYKTQTQRQNYDTF